MKLSVHHSELPSTLEEALERFEKEFSYPLGPVDHFRISHGGHYLRFFEAIGGTALILAEENREVLGSIVGANRFLRLTHDGSHTDLKTHYLCDLKVRSSARGGLALAWLIKHSKRWIEASDTIKCYCVVMGGTGRSPVDYTGRLGIPAFNRVGEISILRLSSANFQNAACEKIGQEAFANIFRKIERPGYSPVGGDPSLRSSMTPYFLATKDGDACGMLEDTNRGKRLFLESGPELVSCHLSHFAYSSPEAAAELLTASVEAARAIHVPTVFVAVPVSKNQQLLPLLNHLQVTEASATIYAHDLEPNLDWWIDTAEI